MDLYNRHLPLISQRGKSLLWTPITTFEIVLFKNVVNIFKILNIGRCRCMGAIRRRGNFLLQETVPIVNYQFEIITGHKENLGYILPVEIVSITSSKYLNLIQFRLTILPIFNTEKSTDLKCILTKLYQPTSLRSGAREISTFWKKMDVHSLKFSSSRTITIAFF